MKPDRGGGRDEADDDRQHEEERLSQPSRARSRVTSTPRDNTPAGGSSGA